MSSKTSKLTLVKNKKIDCLYHKESMLVFKSASEKLVIGRIENDEVLPLDEQALELCQEYGFKYDESLVETEEASHEEQVEESHSETPHQPTSQAPSQTSHQLPLQATHQPSSQSSHQLPPQATHPQSSQPIHQPSSQPSSQPIHQPFSQAASQAASQTPPQQTSQGATNSFEDSKVIFSQFSQLLADSTLSIEKYFQNQINVYSDKVEKSAGRIIELESQNLNLRKELDETKKKMRGILAAIQADL